MLKIPLLVSLGHHGGRSKVASLRPPFSTPLRSLGEPDPETPFVVPIEHAPPLFVRIREDKISLKISPAPLHGPIAHTYLFFFLDGYFSVVFCLIIPSLSSPCWQQLLASGQWPPVSVACSVFSSCFSPNFPSSAPLQAACAACKSSLPWILQAEKHAQRQPSAPWPNTPAGSALKLKREYRRCLIYFEAAFRCVMRNGTVEP